MRTHVIALLGITLASGTAVLAQPVISTQGPVNSASYRKAGLPGSGIAQGSIFTLFGTGLGPGAYAQANSFPLPTTLSGTSVEVTVGDVATSAVVLFAYATQVNAILPSTTPIGEGAVTVTYNGQTSASAPIQVVGNAFGIFAYNSSGSGQAIATDTNYQLNTVIHTFHPGDYVFLWGTGLGPISASDAEPPPAGSLPGAVTVHVGNATAAVQYQGRAPCCAGLDQIVFQVPAGVTGCYVPVGVETSGGVGNVGTIAVSGSGQACSDSVLGQDLVSKLAAGQNVKFGYIRLESYLTQGAGQIGADFGVATFSELDAGAAGLAEFGVSNGYCYAVDCSYRCAANGGSYSGTLADSSPAQLDAGALSVATGSSSMPLTQYGGLYEGLLSGNNGSRFLWSLLDYKTGGPGGKDVGPFSASDTTSKLTVQFANLPIYQVLPRTADLQIHWTGGDPTLQNGQVTIGALSMDSTFTQYQLIQCTAPLAAQGFTIPAWILSTLPPSGVESYAGFDYPIGFIWIGQYNKSSTFTAPGLDRGVVTDAFFNRTEVQFQ